MAHGATFTELTDVAIGRLMADFDVGSVASWSRIDAGTINSNYLVEIEGGERFFLRINEGKSDQDVAYEAWLLARLCDAGLPTPRPFQTVDGKDWSEHEGRQVSLFPWIAGTHRGSRCIEPTHAASGARALARLHNLGRVASRRVRAGRYGLGELERRLEMLRRGDDPVVASVLTELEEELAEAQASTARGEAPSGVIHGDLFPDNTVFEGDRVIALLDFEQASTGSLVYDLAVTLNAWCFSDDLVDARFRAAVEGYDAVRPLSALERELMPLELRVAALRFTITRLTDVYLARGHDERKDFRRFLLRLRRWRELGAEGVARLVTA